MIKPNYLPTVMACLFCTACILFTVLNRLLTNYALVEFESSTVGRQITGWPIVAAGWPIAGLFTVCGGFASLLMLYLLTIRPLQLDLASQSRQRIEAESRRKAADRRAAAAELACDIELDRLDRLAAELQRKTACVDEIGAELHEKRMLLDQRLREAAAKPKPKRGGSSKF